jgi:hypothetical protein
LLDFPSDSKLSGGSKTGSILLYVEDFKLGSNKDIGPKDIFEMGSKNNWLELRYYQQERGKK